MVVGAIPSGNTGDGKLDNEDARLTVVLLKQTQPTPSRFPAFHSHLHFPVQCVQFLREWVLAAGVQRMEKAADGSLRCALRHIAGIHRQCALVLGDWLLLLI
jgi:hypothetical protein